MTTALPFKNSFECVLPFGNFRQVEGLQWELEIFLNAYFLIYTM